MLGYHVRFPLSLIINRKAITKYQLIFRHLFYCKHVERLLCSTWLLQAKHGVLGGKRANFKNDSDSEEHQFLGRMCALRNKMLAFVQQFLFYCCCEVLEPNWVTFEDDLTRVR